MSESYSQFSLLHFQMKSATSSSGLLFNPRVSPVLVTFAFNIDLI